MESQNHKTVRSITLRTNEQKCPRTGSRYESSDIRNSKINKKKFTLKKNLIVQLSQKKVLYISKFFNHKKPTEKLYSLVLIIFLKVCIYRCTYLKRASLIAQLVKNPPAMQETPVRFLGQEDPLEKG